MSLAKLNPARIGPINEWVGHEFSVDSPKSGPINFYLQFSLELPK